MEANSNSEVMSGQRQKLDSTDSLACFFLTEKDLLLKQKAGDRVRIKPRAGNYDMSTNFRYDYALDYWIVLLNNASLYDNINNVKQSAITLCESYIDNAERR